MSTLKRVTAALVLTFAVAISASAGITECPPCVPGETCASAPESDDSVAPGITETPPAANADSEYSFTDVMLDVIQGTLFLF